MTARNSKGSDTATSAITSIVAPVATITNHRPTLTILRVRFTGSTVYATFRICDDSFKNLAIAETDSRPGKLSLTRRFATLVPPRPCALTRRHWLPAARFRGPGRTLTLRNGQVRPHQPARATHLHAQVTNLTGSRGRNRDSHLYGTRR